MLATGRFPQSPVSIDFCPQIELIFEFRKKIFTVVTHLMALKIVHYRDKPKANLLQQAFGKK